MNDNTLVPVSGPEIIEVETTPTRLFAGASPLEVVVKATEVANALAPVIEAKKLFTMIGGRRDRPPS